MKELKMNSTQQERTDALLAYYRGMHNEFYMLKGILCMTHSFHTSPHMSNKEYFAVREDENKIDSIFNHHRIAERMDEINREARQAA